MTLLDTIQSPTGQEWQAAYRSLGIDAAETHIQKFIRLYDLLSEANKTTNLTRITTPEDFLYRHLLDSLVIAPLIGEGSRVVDVGSGAGFPAIPLAILRPDLQVTAIESTGKKCQFIAAVQEALGLDNLTVFNERSELVGRNPQYRESFDTVTARAVAALPVLLELCLPLAKPEGRFLAMKGMNYEEELKASDKALHVLGGKLEEVKTFEHEKLGGSRVLIFSKIKSCPPKYPRSPGTPSRKPL